MGSRHDDDSLVYSSEHGNMCPQCQKKLKACDCSKGSNIPKGDGIVRVGRQTKGRKGKGVTVITGVLLPEKELKALAKELKKNAEPVGRSKTALLKFREINATS